MGNIEQNFEQKSVVSIWVFRQKWSDADAEKDVLKEFCGVEDYDLDSQEGAIASEVRPLESFLSQVSYAGSFIDQAIEAAARMGISEGYGVLAQFDFAYDPKLAAKKIAKDPVFIGYFKWYRPKRE